MMRAPSLTIVGGGQGNLGFEFLYNWTVVNNDATSNTLTITDRSGNPTVYTILAGSSPTFKKVPTQTYALTGTSIGATATWPAEADPNAVTVPGPVSITGTVDTNIKAVGGTSQTAGAQIAGIEAAAQTSASVVATIDGQPVLQTDAGIQTVVPSSDSPTGNALATKVEAA